MVVIFILLGGKIIDKPSSIKINWSSIIEPNIGSNIVTASNLITSNKNNSNCTTGLVALCIGPYVLVHRAQGPLHLVEVAAAKTT